MSDTTEGALARVRSTIDAGAIGLAADLRAILAHIDAQAAEIERLRAALIAAMEIVQEDRLVLYRTALDPRTETVTDPYSLAALADYDRVIAQADAALGSERCPTSI